MDFDFEEKDLDLILVPAGLLIMFIYHLYFIYKVLTNPTTTVVGYENYNRMAWVESVMQDTAHLSLALSVISTNTTSAIYLATFCITLSTLVGAWVGSSSGSLFKNVFILGDRSSATVSLKYICMLVAFMMAFGSFVQSARYCVQADFFVSTPNTDLPVKYVKTSVLRANNFWHVGLRMLYFAMVLLFWSFGPVPMFASSVITVVCLAFLDYNSTPLHQYGTMAKSPVKKVVEDVAAAIRKAEGSAKMVVEEVVSTVTAIEHHGVWKS